MEVKDIAIDEIEIGDRFREEYGDLEELADSYSDVGMLQPISVAEKSDGGYKLLAGGRRVSAAVIAEWTHVPAIIYPEDTSEERATEIELVENCLRLDYHWLERARNERALYRLKKQEGAGQREVAAILNESAGSLNRRIQLADAADKFPHIGRADTEASAWKSLQKLLEDASIAILTKRHQDSLGKVGLSESGSSSEWLGGDGKLAGVSEAPEGEAEDNEERAERLRGWGVSEEEIKKELSLPKEYILAQGWYNVGDALEGLRELDDATVKFLEVDPPYGIELDKIKQTRDGGEDIASTYQDLSAGEYFDWVSSLADDCYRVLAPNTFCVFWFGQTHWQATRDALQGAGFIVNDIPGIWDKGNTGQCQQPNIHLANCWEPFWVCRKGSPVLRKQGRSNIFRFDPVTPGKKIHHTERPLELMEEILQTFAYPASSVCSPFLGSGVTIRAALNQDMTCFGWDLSEEHRNRFLLQLAMDYDVLESE